MEKVSGQIRFIGKIKGPIKRIDILMPQYLQSNTNRTGKVSAIPYPWWRSALPWIPYFVGSRVMFRLKIERDGGLIMYEKFGDQIYDTFAVISDDILRGNIIPRECDIEYFLALPNEKKFIAENIVNLMTTKVTSTDRWSLGCVGLILGAIGTIIAGIILGFIKIIPFWQVWILSSP